MTLIFKSVCFLSCLLFLTTPLHAFELTFQVENLEGAPVQGAEIDLEDHEVVTTDFEGEADYSELDEGNYSYKVAVNGYEYWDEVYIEDSMTESVVLNLVEFDIELTEHWQLISFPAEAADMTAGAVFGDHFDEIELLKYDGGEDVPVGEDEELVPGEGYMLRAEETSEELSGMGTLSDPMEPETQTVTISGEPFEEIELDFDEGWNWKGIPDGIAPVEAGEIFANFEDLPTINKRAGDGSRSPIREDDELEAGEAYLINVDEPVTIEVTSD